VSHMGACVHVHVHIAFPPEAVFLAPIDLDVDFAHTATDGNEC
jgi:hypothetical protein